ncbi:hypothetical protein [Gilvimarinus agarilyticus]|uniref:hypothetical protein n=1 Tax=Gilvimarinus agarilyticus TaxID=679259 RepID=UPI0005A0A63C|nr:hypothetical protein [Gilvimarinus agarilyticus]
MRTITHHTQQPIGNAITQTRIAVAAFNRAIAMQRCNIKQAPAAMRYIKRAQQLCHNIGHYSRAAKLEYAHGFLQLRLNQYTCSAGKGKAA